MSAEDALCATGLEFPRNMPSMKTPMLKNPSMGKDISFSTLKLADAPLPVNAAAVLIVGWPTFTGTAPIAPLFTPEVYSASA